MHILLIITSEYISKKEDTNLNCLNPLSQEKVNLSSKNLTFS